MQLAPKKFCDPKQTHPDTRSVHPRRISAGNFGDDPRKFDRKAANCPRSPVLGWHDTADQQPPKIRAVESKASEF